jgi:hypothetical protein
MRVIQSTQVMIVALGMMFAAGCAIPTMNMKHEASVGVTYKTKGTLEVQTFADNRAGDENAVGKTAGNTLTPQIWSGSTTPEMMTFFQMTLEAEARNAGIFNIDQGDFTLSGSVSSIKVDRTCTVFRYLTLGILDFPKLKATVVFDARLSRRGEDILTKHITHTKSSRYWAMTELSWTQVSDKARRVLDDAITESIKLLFDEIDQQVKQQVESGTKKPPTSGLRPTPSSS